MSQTTVTSYFTKEKRRAKNKVLSNGLKKEGVQNITAKLFNLDEVQFPTSINVFQKPINDRPLDVTILKDILKKQDKCEVAAVPSVSRESDITLPSTPVKQQTPHHTPKRPLSNSSEPVISSNKRRKAIPSESDSISIVRTPNKDKKFDNHSTVRKQLILADDPPVATTNCSTVVRKPYGPKFKGLSKLVSPVKNIPAESIKPASSAVSAPARVLDQETSSLPLPPAYKLVLEYFRCTDTVVSMLYNRKEVCTFAKLKEGVQSMTKRQFTETHLAQIKTVCPCLFNFTVEKTSSSSIYRNPQIPHHQLVINPNLKDYKEEIKGMSPLKMAQNASPSKMCSSASFMPMSPICLVERKRFFTSCLMKIAKQHHQDFLSKLDPPVVVPMDKLTRWHPKFDLTNVPDIEASALPELPDVHKVSSAKDVLSKIAEKHCDSIKRALEFVASRTQSEKAQVAVEPKKKQNKWLKGIDTDLLQRIRQREAAKTVASMMISPKERERKKMLERIPELVRTLRTHFLVVRKAAITLEEATQKLSSSCRGFLSAVEAEDHIKFMAEIFPKWMTLFEIRKIQFLKIDKNMDINNMIESMPKQ